MQRNRGFTLLELLVVLVLLGIITTLAVLSMGSGGLNRKLEQEGRRFVSLIELAGDEAILHGRELGIDFNQTEYRFLALEEGKWLPYQGDKIFRTRTLPDTAFYKLFIDDLPVELSEQFDLDSGPGEPGEPGESDSLSATPLKPQLFILSSGERNAFELQLLTQGESHYQISGDMLGELSMNKLSAEP